MFILKTLQSAYGFLLTRNNSQDKGLGKMTEVNVMPLGIRIDLGLRKQGSHFVCCKVPMTLLIRMGFMM